MKRKALLLDRDGVINVDHGFIGEVERFDFMDGIFDLLRAARDRGYLIVVVTNQSGVARGLYSQEDFEAVNAHMLAGLREKGVEPDLVLACFCHPEGTDEAFRRASFWRKPSPGMVLEAALRLDLDLARCVMIGDKETDMLTGLDAGVGCCLLLHEVEPLPKGARRIADLSEALALLP